MRKCCLLLLLIPFVTVAQKKNKIEKLSFCGWRFNEKDKIISQFQDQFDFLQVHDGDTIVDIGAQSGSYEGCFMAAMNVKDVSFVLVDIDSSCMNQQKIDNMINHYSSVKGEPIKGNFQLIHNTVDSLWLPAGQYQNAWILHTLHEIPDRAKMVKDINFILKPDGEIIVLELGPRKTGQLHGGCNKPLMTLDEINRLFTANGFMLNNQLIIKKKKRFDVVLLRYIKQ